MKSEYYNESILKEHEPFVMMKEINRLTHVNNFDGIYRNPVVVSCINVLNLELDNLTRQVVKTFCEHNPLMDLPKFLGLSCCSSSCVTIDYLKELLKNGPVACNVSFSKCGWVILLGMFCKGNASEDSVLLYDMDGDDLIIHNLTGFVWMCNDVQMIFKEVEDK